MRTIKIDGKELTNKEQLHNKLKSALKLPDYYGNNLDALWDCLTSDVELPIEIRWENFEDSKLLLGDYADKTLQLMLKAQNYLDGEFIVLYN